MRSLSTQSAGYHLNREVGFFVCADHERGVFADGLSVTAHWATSCSPRRAEHVRKRVVIFLPAPISLRTEVIA